MTTIRKQCTCMSSVSTLVDVTYNLAVDTPFYYSDSTLKIRCLQYTYCKWSLWLERVTVHDKVSPSPMDCLHAHMGVSIYYES